MFLREQVANLSDAASRLFQCKRTAIAFLIMGTLANQNSKFGNKQLDLFIKNLFSSILFRIFAAMKASLVVIYIIAKNITFTFQKYILLKQMQNQQREIKIASSQMLVEVCIRLCYQLNYHKKLRFFMLLSVSLRPIYLKDFE